MEEEDNLASFEDEGVSELEAGCGGGEERVVGTVGEAYWRAAPVDGDGTDIGGEGGAMEESTDEDLEWPWQGGAVAVSSEVGVLVEMRLGNGTKKTGDERHPRKLIIAERRENLVDYLIGKGI